MDDAGVEGLDNILSCGCEDPNAAAAMADEDGKLDAVPVGDRVVKGLCVDEGTCPGVPTRGNGYDGVLANMLVLGVTPPRIVWLDSIESLVEVVDGGDMGLGELGAKASSSMGDTLEG